MMFLFLYLSKVFSCVLYPSAMQHLRNFNAIASRRNANFFLVKKQKFQNPNRLIYLRRSKVEYCINRAFSASLHRLASSTFLIRGHRRHGGTRYNVMINELAIQMHAQVITGQEIEGFVN